MDMLVLLIILYARAHTNNIFQILVNRGFSPLSKKKKRKESGGTGSAALLFRWAIVAIELIEFLESIESIEIIEFIG